MKPQDKETLAIMRYAGLAMQWGILLGLACWIGWTLDKWLEWKFPLFLVSLPLIALIFSMWKLIKDFSKPKK